MFFTGMLQAAPTLVNFQADLIGILTGAITTPAGLSSNFSSASFINTVAPGWALHDAAAGTAANGVTPKVINAPWSDDGTKYKNMLISSINTTQLGFVGYHTWNEVAHTGTFPTSAPAVATSWQSITLTAGQQVTISASANHLLILLNAVGGATSNLIGIFEFTRDDPWRTVANGYPAWLQCGAGPNNGSNATAMLINSAIPYAYNLATAADTAPAMSSTNVANSATFPGSVFVPVGLAASHNTIANCGGAFTGYLCDALNAGTQGADANRAAAKYLFDLGYVQGAAANSYTPSTWLGGNISAKCPYVYLTHGTLGAPGDDMVSGTDTYWVARTGITGRFLIKKV